MKTKVLIYVHSSGWGGIELLLVMTALLHKFENIFVLLIHVPFMVFSLPLLVCKLFVYRRWDNFS